MPRVYDDQETGADQEYDKRAISPEQRRQEIDDLERSFAEPDADELERGFNAPSIGDEDRNTPNKGASLGDKASADEAKQLSDTVGKGYTGMMGPQEPMGRRGARKVIKFLVGSQKRRVMTLLLTGGITMIGGLSLLSLLPAKSIQIMLGLQDHFFGVGEDAVEDTVERMLSRYLIKQVLPGMSDGLCTTTRVDKTCALAIDGDGPINQVFKAWRQNKLESKLATEFDIEIIRLGEGPNANFYIRAPGIGKEDVELGSAGRLVNYDGNIFEELEGNNRKNGKKVRLLVKDATKELTAWKRTYYRFKINRHIEFKYGLRLCMLVCDGKDNADAWGKRQTDKLKAGRALMTKVVYRPLSEGHSLMMECALSGFDCGSYDAPGDDGVRRTKYESDLRNRVITARNTDPDFDLLMKDADTIKQKGLTVFVIEKIFGKATAKMAAYAVPIVGWLDLAITINQGAQHLGPALRYLEYSTKSMAAVSVFTTFRTAVDEQRSGDTESITMGSLVTMLNEGKYAAEDSPLYHKIFGSTLFLTSDDTAKASAKMQQMCENEGGVHSSGLICENESLVSSNVTKWALTGSQAVIAQYSLVPGLQPLMSGWMELSGLLGKVVGFITGPIADRTKEMVMNFVASNPALQAWVDARQEELMKVVTAAMSMLFKPGLANEPNGANWFVQSAIGATSIANTVNRDDNGAARVTQEQANQYQELHEVRRDDEFANSSWYARMFDTENTRSFASRLALSLPMNDPGMPYDTLRTYASSLSTIPMNILRTLAATFPHANAVKGEEYENPAGVQLNIHAQDNPARINDPQEVWNTYQCGEPDQEKKWAEQYGKIDGVDVPSWRDALSSPNILGQLQNLNNTANGADKYTQQFELTKDNPCKLLKSSIVAAGALFDKTLIPERVEPAATEPINTTGDSATGGAGTGTVSKDGWVWPIQKGLQAGPCYGRNVGSLGKHAGMDINASVVKAPVYAMHDGEVVSRTIDTYAGLNIRIKTPEGIYYWYQHLSSASVVVGNTVKANQQIATGGKTGRVFASSPVHLHVVVSKANDYPSYGSLKASFDPMSVLPTPAPDNYKCY